MIIPYSIFAVVVVYTVCTLIELLRQKTVERVFLKAVNRYADDWLRPFENICESLKKMIFGE